MNIKRFFLLFLILNTSVVKAAEWVYGIEGYAQGLYGYSDTSRHNQGVGQANIDSFIKYILDNQDSFSFHLDLMLGIDQEIQDYNQGRWGEEAYVVYNSNYGQIMLGQVFNVASLFHNSAPAFGALSSNNDVADFINNPNWRRTVKETKFATLNSTDINTDGVAPKINYISPEFYGTAIGFSYVPDSYNRRGLINKQAKFAHKDGFIGAIYNDTDWGLFSSQSSFGYAQYHGNDKEFSYSLTLKRGNWSLGGGYRKTYIDGSNKINSNKILPLDFDGYREGEAWNIGLGYEIGPFLSSISYFESSSSKTDNKNKTIAFSNEYQLNKSINVYIAAAYADSKSNDIDKDGYALVTGVGLKF